jgi:hypothetical protein
MYKPSKTIFDQATIDVKIRLDIDDTQDLRGSRRVASAHSLIMIAGECPLTGAENFLRQSIIPPPTHGTEWKFLSSD